MTATPSSSSTTPLPSDNSWVDDPSSLTTRPKYNNHLQANNDSQPHQNYHPVLLLPHATESAASFSTPSSIPDGASAKLGQPSCNRWRISDAFPQYNLMLSCSSSSVILPWTMPLNLLSAYVHYICYKLCFTLFY